EARQLAGLTRGGVAPPHPGAEPRRRHRDERRASSVLAALADRRLEPDQRPGVGPLEADVDRDVVERALPRDALARLPGRDARELQRVALVDLEDPAADSGLATHLDEPARVVRVDRPTYPPEVELVGEGRERRLRVRRHFDRGLAGPRFTHRSLLLSTYCLKDASCSSLAAWSSSSHSRSGAIDSGPTQNNAGR